MWNIIVWIVFGFVAGAVAKLLKPGKDPGSWIITIIIGILGSIVGGFIGRFLGLSGGTNNFSLVNFLLAVGGAIILLYIYTLFTKMKG
jgi:uncharacterized membrane protein YeaQ/YmgE (transglycosylase-associated protein family)